MRGNSPTGKNWLRAGVDTGVDVIGRHGWKARYVKEVDNNEETLRFYQEVFNDKGDLAEVHEKFPLDRGHKGAKG
jgi:hypothetical protein